MTKVLTTIENISIDPLTKFQRVVDVTKTEQRYDQECAGIVCELYVLTPDGQRLPNPKHIIIWDTPANLLNPETKDFQMTKDQFDEIVRLKEEQDGQRDENSDFHEKEIEVPELLCEYQYFMDRFISGQLNMVDHATEKVIKYDISGNFDK